MGITRPHCYFGALCSAWPVPDSHTSPRSVRPGSVHDSGFPKRPRPPGVRRCWSQSSVKRGPSDSSQTTHAIAVETLDTNGGQCSKLRAHIRQAGSSTTLRRRESALLDSLMHAAAAPGTTGTKCWDLPHGGIAPISSVRSSFLHASLKHGTRRCVRIG